MNQNENTRGNVNDNTGGSAVGCLCALSTPTLSNWGEGEIPDASFFFLFFCYRMLIKPWMFAHSLSKTI